MKKLRKSLPVIAAMVLGTCLSSCDNSYDLSKDINTDITLGSNFSVPVGQTEKIMLERIIKPDGSLTVNNNGLYEISSDGNFDAHIDPIDPVRVNGFDPVLQDVVIDLTGDINMKKSRAVADFSTDINTTASYSINEALPKEVESVSVITISSNNTYPVKTILSVSVDNIPNGIESVSLKDFSMEFPEIFSLAGRSGNIVKIDELKITKDNPYANIDIDIIGLDIPSNLQSKYIKDINGEKYIVIEDDLKIDSKAVISLDSDALSASHIVLKFQYIVPVVEITRVSGKLVPDTKIENQIALNDIPDFIKGNGTTFTPSDLSLNLEVNNPVNTSLLTNLSITPWNDEKNIPEGEPVIIPIEFEANQNNKFIISNKSKDVPAGYTNIVNPQLATLLTKVPDSFKIESDKIISESEGTNEYIQLGVPFDIDGDYEIVVPFEFENLKIFYTDSITNLVSDLKDVSDKTDKIIVSAKGYSMIPTELMISVKLYDINENELNGINVELSKFKFAPSVDGEESVSDLEIILTQKEGSHDLELLEKIKYTVEATSMQNGIKLKPVQYLQIKNILAKIPNGINLTL